MKQFKRIGIGLACSLLVLSACSTGKQLKTSQHKKQTKVDTTMSIKSTTSTSASDSKNEASRAESSKDYDSLYQSTISELRADPNRKATLYAFYDIDRNGTKELFSGYIDSNGVNQPLAVYYLKGGVPTYLAENAVGGAGGRRAGFQVNEDGTVSQSEISSANGNGTITLYKLKEDNTGLDIIQEVTVEKLQPQGDIPSNDSPIDLSQLEWQNLSIPEESRPVNSKSIDVMAISQGDLSSIVGTYTGLNGGNTFTFNINGTGHITSSNAGWDVAFTNFHLENGAAVFNTTNGPEMFYIVPAGVASAYDTDDTDINRNRGYVNHNKFYLD